MKHFLLLVSLLAGVTLFAADQKAAPAAKTAQPAAKTAEAASQDDAWEVISLTFTDGVPEAKDVLNVFGVKVGVPMGFGGPESFVSGTEISVIGSMTREIYGVQGAILFCDADRVDGLQASFIYNFSKVVNGLQFSVVNHAKEGAVQLGLINIIEDSPVYVMPFLNFY